MQGVPAEPAATRLRADLELVALQYNLLLHAGVPFFQ